MEEARSSDPLAAKIHDSFFGFAKQASTLRGHYELPLYRQRARYHGQEPGAIAVRGDGPESDRGMPVGLQLIGMPRDKAARLAAAYDRHRRRWAVGTTPVVQARKHPALSDRL